MEVAVFDTYVKKVNGGLMHFDIIVPTNTEVQKVLEFGRRYLKEKGQEKALITSKECQFCHVEYLLEHMEEDINENGYYIIEMQGC